MVRKKYILLAMTSLSLLSIGACQSTNSKSANENEQPKQTSQKEISEKKAKKIAFDEAKVKDVDSKNVTVKKDKDDDKIVYEVEFENGKDEYSYSIDIYSGKIIEHSKEAINE